MTSDRDLARAALAEVRQTIARLEAENRELRAKIAASGAIQSLVATPSPRQQLGIDGSKFAMHGAVTSTTPPAAPVAVTDAMVEAASDAYIRTAGDPGSHAGLHAAISAALAAAASAANGGKA